MEKFNPDKLTVEFREGVTEITPIIPRRYTLTGQDITGEYYLIIGPDFVFDKVSSGRDVVLGEWLWVENGIRFYVYLNMDGKNGQGTENPPDDIPDQELAFALQAIRYGDRHFFERFPENTRYSILGYFLYTDPEENRAEFLGSFSDYSMTAFSEQTVTDPVMEHRVLLDEKTGDVTGDGVPDIVSVYGDKTADSDYIHSIIIEARYGQTGVGYEAITELNGYNPVLFLGDFNRDKVADILFRMDKGFNSMDSRDKGSYLASVDAYNGESFDTVFTSERYNTEYRFVAEYMDFYKVRVFTVKLNKLFYLDIRYKGRYYLSRYYKEDGKLIRPVYCPVLGAKPIIPVVSSLKDNYYDLLMIHQIIGTSEEDTLGRIENLLSWDGKGLFSVNITVCAPGTDLIPPAKIPVFV